MINGDERFGIEMLLSGRNSKWTVLTAITQVSYINKEHEGEVRELLRRLPGCGCMLCGEWLRLENVIDHQLPSRSG